MNILKVFLIFFFLIHLNSVKADDQDERNQITKNLRCLVCQGQSVYDSDSEFANSLKILVKQKLNEGLSENQIYDYLKIKYGEWILYDPELNKNTYILWLLPILIFLIGGVIVFKNFFKKKKDQL
ncbi:cytochrome c-type biogenesis protein CcmH [Candidatus Pelagibacter sp.]|jgi:cytochrome c-type biogenesis protein CcmH|uniref:cytochrome c-type biogenesis protein n=1 Tax=uncultured Candidatus Pelagibacter sp. TaxID=372654 RepID=UPI002339EA92|nr:cytochrome c-type biogenesis protein [uncultured Candidatus Pelagibacter sp.]MDB4811548.1 cytochrome c-type biogenesis protein CcmH [Candidatus Pelagibacter sp.]MDC0465718.1 cytochrome c-type biogenesis protein CcmH [Candidatus Pelagibacter sp.]MDC1077973.1 cytochrome c-type biogenesis protein CcmH [Candidatus Pelagibacter sp.]|tara:strand:- start:413 stop:787 length:375 start_codon:yes stop_codon:yes gene_type:complete